MAPGHHASSTYKGLVAFPNDLSSEIDRLRKLEELKRQRLAEEQRAEEEAKRQKLLSADQKAREKQVADFESKIKSLEKELKSQQERVASLTQDVQTEQNVSKGFREKSRSDEQSYKEKVTEVSRLTEQIGKNQRDFDAKLKAQIDLTTAADASVKALKMDLTNLEKAQLGKDNNFPPQWSGKTFFIVNQSTRSVIDVASLFPFGVALMMQSSSQPRLRMWTIGWDDRAQQVLVSKVDSEDPKSAWTLSYKTNDGEKFIGFDSPAENEQPVVRSRGIGSDKEKQEWFISMHSDGAWYIRNKWSSKYIDSESDVKLAQGTNLRSKDWMNWHSSRWMFVAALTR